MESWDSMCNHCVHFLGTFTVVIMSTVDNLLQFETNSISGRNRSIN